MCRSFRSSLLVYKTDVAIFMLITGHGVPMHHDLMIKLCISHAASMSTLPCHKKSAKNERNSAPCPWENPDLCSSLKVPSVAVFAEPSNFLSTQLQKTSLARRINFWKVVIYRDIYICLFGRDSSIFHNNLKLVLHTFHSRYHVFHPD